MSRMQDLDHLLGADEPHASFHDASLFELRINYAMRTVSAVFELSVGNPDAVDATDRERRRIGALELAGLTFWAQEPPDLRDPAWPDHRPWLTADGPLREVPTETAQRLARGLPPEAWAWYLYFSDWNAFAYCAAARAEFRWVR